MVHRRSGAYSSVRRPRLETERPDRLLPAVVRGATVTEDAGPGFDPAESSIRLAIEQYLRYRIVETDRPIEGWYTRLRSFAEWCERAGIDSVDSLRGSDVLAYYDYRRIAAAGMAIDRELRPIDEFCEYLEAVGAIDHGLPATVHRLESRSGHRSNAETAGGDEPCPGMLRRSFTPEFHDRTTDRDRPGGETGPVEFEIQAGDPVSTAVVRAVSAIDGRPRQFLPPLSNVVDPAALDDLFDGQSDGTPRTGGHLTFVYASCQVTVESGAYLELTPLGATSGENENPRPDALSGCRSTPL
jgi:hypothetical protein